MRGQQLNSAARLPELLDAARRLQGVYAVEWDCYLHQEGGVPFLIAFVPDRLSLTKNESDLELLAGEIGYTAKKAGILEVVVPESDPLARLNKLYKYLNRWILTKSVPLSKKKSQRTPRQQGETQ